MGCLCSKDRPNPNPNINDSIGPVVLGIPDYRPRQPHPPIIFVENIPVGVGGGDPYARAENDRDGSIRSTTSTAASTASISNSGWTFSHNDSLGSVVLGRPDYRPPVGVEGGGGDPYARAENDREISDSEPDI